MDTIEMIILMILAVMGGLDECYYLISADGSVKESKPPMVGNCSRCPYGKHSPCIGYCIAKLQYEMKERKKQGKGEQNGK